ncbi:DUF4395 domain-containing protein [soil metagenome]
MTATSPKPTLHAKPGQQGIDPRSPRFGAGITAVLLLVVIALSLLLPVGDTFAARASHPAFLLFVVITLLFAWGAFAGVQHHPYGRIYRALVRPRLAAPTDLEDPVPPTFAQGVGLVITLLGVIVYLLGVPLALPIAAGLAFIAAFLNSVFAYCLGCQIYLLLVRGGILGRGASTSA